jgi:GT2 family glycosyltransferase
LVIPVAPKSDAEAPYLLAVASTAPLPPLPGNAILVDPGWEILRGFQGVAAEALVDLRARHLEADQSQGELEHSPDAVRARARAYDAVLRQLRDSQRRSAHPYQRQARLQEELRTLRAQRDQALVQLRETNTELALIKASGLWRLGTAYRALFQRVAPPGSRRWTTYRRVRQFDDQPPAATPVEAHPPDPVPPLWTSTEPEVSIVLPVHNNWALTAACLRSLAVDDSTVDFEVIVVDDGSKDETRTLLPLVSGITTVRLDENRGFLQAVNQGLVATKGRFVILLNNDTSVWPGWLDALVETARNSPDVGVVGAKLVYPDGRLQEAGGIIFDNAQGLNFGRGDNPDAPMYNFTRDVDYCSGACLLVRREILDTLGGLDSRYDPAYYEDTDLAFAARGLGYRVVYQPGAVVTHIEGASCGTDLEAGLKRYQAVNREVFRSKWKEELKVQLPCDPQSIRAASWRSSAGRSLVIDGQIPTPDRDAGSRRMFELLQLLTELGFAVTFAAASPGVVYEGADEHRYAADLRQLGVEVLGDAAGIPDLLAQLGPRLRLAVLSRPSVAQAYLPVVRDVCPGAKVIYDTVDLHHLRELRRAGVESDPEAARAADHMRTVELELAQRSDVTFVVSEAERQILRTGAPGAALHVIPTIHRDADPGLPFGKRHGLLFVGAFPHLPNQDAACWLVEAILPLLRDRLPGVHTYIVGSSPPEEIHALASDTVHVVGWVPDLSDLYDRARVFVAPLRYGAGMKGKIGESMAHGLPVVTTRLGGEGMDLEHERDALLAESAEGLAESIARLYHEPRLWASLAANGRDTVLVKYSPPAVRSLLASSLTELGLLLPNPPEPGPGAN